jgi:hypothetical protein
MELRRFTRRVIMQLNCVCKPSAERAVHPPKKLPGEAMTVQVRDGKMFAVDGSFMETKEALGGIVAIEARDLNEAVRVEADNLTKDG